MFWLFAPTQPQFSDTLVGWHNGGPGCSSIAGSLFENGPVTIQRYPAGSFGMNVTGPLEYNRYAWTNATMMLYVEHPHGTGFSHGTFPHNEMEVARDYYNFLQNLYTIFDNPTNNSNLNLRSKRLSFFGESYAGFYVPSIAHYIYQQNQRGQYPYVNLYGIAIGNGWIDAYTQGPVVIDYAWWHGMIDSSTASALHREWHNCQDGSPQAEPFHAFTTPDECGILSAVLQAAGTGIVDWGAPNGYDVTTWDTYQMLDSPETRMAQFMNNPQVQQALHVGKQPPSGHWSVCIPGAGRRQLRQQQRMRHKDKTTLLPLGETLLKHDKPVTMAPYLVTLLDEAKIRVLIYNGDRDLTTSAPGSERVLDSLPWDGARGWMQDYERGLWLPFEKTLGGYVKAFRNLEFLVVINSGHLVPFNRDRVALDLVSRFLANKSYLDRSLPKFNIVAKQRNRNSNSDGTVDAIPGRRHLFSLGSTVLLAFLAFATGFVLARRIPTAHHGYEYLW